MHQNNMNDPSGLHGLPNGHANGFSNGYSPLQQSLQHEASSNEGESSEDLIPTAIVIKNIPFAIKREQLADMMANLGLPAPYAFNYHFDNGVFRGLAFANFTNPAETKIVIDAMNHMDLAGRKLRVEYKKMLPAAERERIEREKRHRRGQLEEQHRPTGSLNHQASMNSLSSHPPRPTQSPSPVSARGPTPGAVDMNDPYTLQMYADMIAFKHNPDRQVLTFGPALTSVQRRIAHELAQKAGLFHDSVGPDDRRSVQISKQKFTPVMATDLQSTNQQINDSRRGLSRAATTDFSESRDAFHGLRSQQSGLLDIPHEPSIHAAQSLRGAKSFGDLQTRMPSPANSLGNFPIGLATNVSRYQSYTNGNGSVSSLTPTAARSGEDYISSFANLGINSNYSGVSRFGGRLDNPGSVNGAIGSQRSINNLNGTHDETPRQASSLVDRQPRGPSSQSQGFQRRNNGHVQRRSADLESHDGEESGSRFH
jgi:RNA recognition motif-containing protein